jgi:cadmium resistance protein CadD (predicted permease)
VAVVTVANGADNLSVYIPMFAADISWLPLYVATFAVMTALWSALAWRLVRNRALGALLQRWGHLLLPVVLIALGLNILWGARVLMA